MAIDQKNMMNVSHIDGLVRFIMMFEGISAAM
jgi:hypothetical protein